MNDDCMSVKRAACSKPRATAFSLIELLVVVCIIAVMVGLTIPLIGRCREVANQSLCTSRLKGIGIAFYSYASDNNGMLPAIDTITAGGELHSWSYWGNIICPYIEAASDVTTEKLQCPTITQKAGRGYRSYTLNSGICDKVTPVNGGEPAKTGCLIVSVPNAPQMVMVFCSPQGWTSINMGDIGGHGPGAGYGNIVTPVANRSFYGEVHFGKAEVLYADGHVSANRFLDINNTKMWVK
jgi:prepilin-type processing-associated H-X9-DG protein